MTRGGVKLARWRAWWRKHHDRVTVESPHWPKGAANRYTRTFRA